MILGERRLKQKQIFNWICNKQNGHQETSKPGHTTSSLACHMNIQNKHNEAYRPRPESLLSIGTFGTNDLRAAKQNSFTSNNRTVEPDPSDFTMKEVANLMKKLENMGVERLNLTMDKFMNCSASLIDPNCENYKHISSASKIVISKGKDLSNEMTCVLKKRSLIFIINFFACRGGFVPVPAPELTDPFSRSRIERLLKSLFCKKVYSQNATTMPTNKYLQRKHQEKLSIEAVAHEKGDVGEKWVKTDSEYIVLEV